MAYNLMKGQMAKFSGPIESYSFSMKFTRENVASTLTIYYNFRKLFSMSSEVEENLNKNASMADDEELSNAITKVGGKENAVILSKEMVTDARKAIASRNFDLMLLLMERYEYCIRQVKNISADCTYTYNLLKCALEDTDELKNIWQRFDDGVNLKKTQFAFTLCARFGGYLPYANSEEEFHTLYKLFGGPSQPIMWGEADKVDGKLVWCNSSAPVPVAVNGSTDRPFFLVTMNGSAPILQAVPLINEIYFPKLYCLHSAEVKRQCDAGTRANQQSTLEKIISKIKEN